ncbi:MAG: hypothetical protein IIC27_01610 [Chloroflexi bacterium]|nr:hypothetical protein [Chloroflexota bacterium]
MGRENLQGVKGPVLFAVNHNAAVWDSLLVLKALPHRWRWRMSIAAAAEIARARGIWILRPCVACDA